MGISLWSWQRYRAERGLWVAYALMALLLVGYLASLIVRGPGRSSELLDGWSVDGFEMLAAALCIVRGFTRRPGRAVALTLGFGLFMWASGTGRRHAFDALARGRFLPRVLPAHLRGRRDLHAWGG